MQATEAQVHEALMRHRAAQLYAYAIGTDPPLWYWHHGMHTLQHVMSYSTSLHAIAALADYAIDYAKDKASAEFSEGSEAAFHRLLDLGCMHDHATLH